METMSTKSATDRAWHLLTRGHGVRLLLAAVVAVAVPLVAALYPFRLAVLSLAVHNPSVLRGVDDFAPLLTCIVPLSVYSALKGTIEMRWTAPRNLLNLVLASGAGLVVYHVLRHRGFAALDGVTRSCLVTFWSLGALTIFAAWPLVRGAAWGSFAGLALVALALCEGAAVFVERSSPARGVQILICPLLFLVILFAWWRTCKPEVLRLAIERAGRAVGARAAT